MSSSAVETDVLICGSGSAGLCAAVWLARMGIDFRVLEKRDGPLRTGQADGVQCRTVEVFESFGLDMELKKDAYWVNEVVFWTEPNANRGIQRVRRTPDVLPGISWQPHVILNQARLNDLLIQEMVRCSGPPIQYSTTVVAVGVDERAIEDENAFAVTAVAEKADGTKVEFRSKYLLVRKEGDLVHLVLELTPM
jgi:phenol 2-monooxygenase (NADPH)